MNFGRTVFSQLMEHLPDYEFQKMRGPLWRRLLSERLLLFGPISVDDVCSVDLPREPTRYLFKLKQSPNVRKLIGKLFGNDQWVNAGQKWQGLATELQLSGWTQKRRVVVLRRPLREGVADEKNSKKKAAKQLTLDLPEATHQGVLYEYAVLVTSMQDEVLAIAQHYRD